MEVIPAYPPPPRDLVLRVAQNREPRSVIPVRFGTAGGGQHPPPQLLVNFGAEGFGIQLLGTSSFIVQNTELIRMRWKAGILKSSQCPREV